MLSISPKNGFYLCLQGLQESSVPGEGSFLARCALKFSEVVAAGVATALSGYVIAHFAAPMFSATQPDAGPRPAANVSANDGAPHLPAKPDAGLVEPAAVGPALPKVSPMKNKPVESPAAQPVLGGAAARRAQDAAARKPNAAQSLEARVRAALARSNGRTALAGAQRRQLQMPSAGPSALPGVEHRASAAAAPAEAAASIASAPRAAALSPQRLNIAPQPAEAPAPPFAPNPAPHALQTTLQEAPGQNSGGQNPDGQNIAGQNLAGQKPDGQNSAIQLTPLTTVVVKPQPSIGTESPQPVPDTADAQASHENRGSGPLSAFARILRSDKPLPEDQAPRPPIAVGQ
jgi:hypothetical protein